MRKYYLAIFTIIVASMNLVFSFLLLNKLNFKIKIEYVIYFYSWLTVFIFFFFNIEFKNEVLNLYQAKYFILFPVKRREVLLKELKYRILDLKFVVLIASSFITLLILGLRANVSSVSLIISLILTIFFNSFFLIVFKNMFNVKNGIKKIQVVSQFFYLVAFLPYFLILGKVNITLDIFSRYLPFGGVFFSLFVYKNIFIYLLSALLFLLILFLLFKKASEKWDI